ncbi:MAG: TIGR03016 family PEP-CTERM system-associated outer membrane protein, partial [Burkholderiales bacterium]|nr:TIGR03016 family PEP-CTERM system-associated outer membrane protein [Burkholderiales bacterium]
MQRHLARPPFVVRAAVTLIVALMAIGSVSAAEWRPSLSIGTNMVFSDNIVLRPAGQERGDVVVTVTPTISIAKTGARLKARGFYSPSFVTYLGGSANDTVRNTLDGTATLEAVENFFFVDGRAQINQTFLSPLGPAPVDAGSATNNRTEVATFGLSPYIRSRLPGGSSYQVRGDLNYTTTTTDSRPDILGTGVQASWNGAGGTFVTPGLEYNYSATQFGNQPAFGSQIARLKGVITFNPEFSVTTSGGYETNDFVFSRTEGVIYGGGFNWKPSPRTNVRANAEHRFFGTSYDYELLYRTRLTAWTLRGARRIQTSQQQMQQLGSSGARASLDLLLSESIPDPVERAQAIDQLLLQSGLGSFLGGPTPIFSPRILLIESVEPSLAIRGARSSLVL